MHNVWASLDVFAFMMIAPVRDNQPVVFNHAIGDYEVAYLSPELSPI
jgi:hypothetical protein